MIGRFQISTEHPTAKDSMDTIHPKGTSMDNSFNVNFNLRVMKLFRQMRGRPRISVLDLGCAGGGMVESFTRATGRRRSESRGATTAWCISGRRGIRCREPVHGGRD